MASPGLASIAEKYNKMAGGAGMINEMSVPKNTINRTHVKILRPKASKRNSNIAYTPTEFIDKIGNLFEGNALLNGEPKSTALTQAGDVLRLWWVRGLKVMKRILVSILALTAIAASSNLASAAPVADSKYCETNNYDPICMKDDMMKMRSDMMAFTKEKAMANRTKYCTDHASDSDPICKPDMINSTTGY